MIWSIGEILADIVVDDGECRVNAGGAPFNAAVAACDAGAEVLFVGRVGCDLLGDGLVSVSERYLPDSTLIQRDESRATTVAIVSLLNGERSFAFCRKDTADYHIDVDEIPFDRLTKGDIVNIGTLALAEKEGAEYIGRICDIVAERDAVTAVDVNFRESLFVAKDRMVAAFCPLVDVSDIVKFSDDELKCYVSESDINAAIEAISERYPHKLIVVTEGDKGSRCIYEGKTYNVGAEKVKAIDTTGAGDAFWGTFLANILSKEWSDEVLREALRLANIAGGEAVKHFGALKPIKP